MNSPVRIFTAETIGIYGALQSSLANNHDQVVNMPDLWDVLRALISDTDLRVNKNAQIVNVSSTYISKLNDFFVRRRDILMYTIIFLIPQPKMPNILLNICNITNRLD